MAACAQPSLPVALRGPALRALASSAERSLKAKASAAQSAELLQGALDAAAVLRALPRERREGLEINLALALLRMGRDEAKQRAPVRR